MVRFNLTDTGNAERFADQHGHYARYVHSLRKWFLWQGEWVEDTSCAVWQLVKKTVRSISDYETRSTQGEITDAEIVAIEAWIRLGEHAKASESAARMKAMLSLAQSECPMTIEQLNEGVNLWERAKGTSHVRAVD